LNNDQVRSYLKIWHSRVNTPWRWKINQERTTRTKEISITWNEHFRALLVGGVTWIDPKIWSGYYKD